MGEKAKINIKDKTYEFPVITGTENESAIDISDLRKETSFITLDNGFANTGACVSAITFLDGEKGILRYRGYPIEQIAQQSSFEETSYLLIHGNLPDGEQLKAFKSSIISRLELPQPILKLFDGYPADGHPMGILSAAVCALSAYYPKDLGAQPYPEDTADVAAHLLAKVNTISAYTYKKSIGQPFVPPRKDLEYIPNFFHMMFSTARQECRMDKEAIDALNALLILHADHEQNCSASAVRLVGSSLTNVFASVSAGICALWGPLHGGANQKVVEMLQEIHADGGDIRKYIDKAKDSAGNYRLMGFGHRVYKNFDPRATIIKKCADDLFAKLGLKDPLLDLAVRLEAAVLKDDYFAQRKLYPNVDFYSGLIYRAMGIPTAMFPVMFAMGRMAGWFAHWKEMREDSKSRIGRPRQIYTGPTARDYVPMQARQTGKLVHKG